MAMARDRDEWDDIHYPALTDAENREIRKARREGYPDMYPAFPTAEAQSRNTLAGAREFLRRERQREEDAVRGETCRTPPDEP